jgi:hypothetical protein
VGGGLLNACLSMFPRSRKYGAYSRTFVRLKSHKYKEKHIFAQKYSFNKGTCYFLLEFRTVINTGLGYIT